MNFLGSFLRKLYPLKSGMGTIANSNIFKRLDGNPAGDTVARSGRFSLVVPQDDYVGRSIKYFGDLDKKISWVVGKVLLPGDVALDIGANLGVVSFRMLDRVGLTGKVIAFEPQSRMTEYIARSITENHIKNLHVHNMGLADKGGTLRLSIPEHNAGAASFSSENGARFEEVPVTTLDDFHHHNKLDEVRMVKIDVEGYEAQIFLGGKKFFTTIKPEIIVFEENRRSKETPEAISIVQSYGYEVFSIPKSLFSVVLRRYEPGAEAHDFVAVHTTASPTVRRKLGI